jgi:hypothetical protein
MLREHLVEADPLPALRERGLRQERVLEILYVNLEGALGIVGLRAPGPLGKARQALVDHPRNPDHRVASGSAFCLAHRGASLP